MATIILRAADLDGYLSDVEKKEIDEMNRLYSGALDLMRALDLSTSDVDGKEAKEKLIQAYQRMGDRMQEFVADVPNINVYSFQTPRESHGEASRLIAKLRDTRTQASEFLYYTQRAYELLFNLAFSSPANDKKNHLIVKTPVTVPVQNYAVHKIPDLDGVLENAVMCVMLRGALLPSMIMSKEIQEYTSTGYVTPFALFRISRDDTKVERNMEYILNLDRSYFDLDSLNDRDLIFADPMNATGGSLVTIVQYLLGQGVRPRSVKFFNAISALKGSMRIARAIENAEIYTLWMDPVLNEAAYILPGLGDAGDRVNGRDTESEPRNIIQLIADYGSNISDLYRAQVRAIEETVLGKHGSARDA